jgi:predicted dehydrogenase
MKIGIVGARRGSAFAAAFQEMKDVAVVALCDLDSQALAATADRFRIPQRFAEYEPMLATDLDAVVVASPMPLHVPHAAAALAAGKHVLSEVPAAVDLTQCWELVSAARASPALYMFSENVNFGREVSVVSEMVRQGLFGEVYFGEGGYIHELKALCEQTLWRREWLLNRNGCTYATHALGPLLEWTGDRVATVSCLGSGRHYRDPRGEPYAMEDSAVMNCKLEGGGLLTLRVDMLSNRPHITTYFTLQGTRGCYESGRGFEERSRVWLTDRCAGPEEWRALADFEAEFLPARWRQASKTARGSDHGGADYQVCREREKRNAGDRRLPRSGHDAARPHLPGVDPPRRRAGAGAGLPRHLAVSRRPAGGTAGECSPFAGLIRNARRLQRRRGKPWHFAS